MSLVLLALHSDEGRLAAILAADIAAYSRLMARTKPKRCATYRSFDRPNMVPRSSSAVRAVECAVASGTPIAERNLHAPKARRKLYHIGVNFGATTRGPSFSTSTSNSRTDWRSCDAVWPRSYP